MGVTIAYMKHLEYALIYRHAEIGSSQRCVGVENKGLQIKSLDIDVISQTFHFTLHKYVEIGVMKC